MEVNFYYPFGDLKAGDKFAYEGEDYVKISGNCAHRISWNPFVVKERTIEINGATLVFLYEIG